MQTGAEKFEIGRYFPNLLYIFEIQRYQRETSILTTMKTRTKKPEIRTVQRRNTGNTRKSDANLTAFTNHRPEAAIHERVQLIANRSTRATQIAQLQHIANSAAPNHTGLPDNLKAGIENLSGYTMDDVSVHHNSDKPAQLHAHAYAQGTDIHIAPGQEKHLPHEAWHVVQQKQGRARPSVQLKAGIDVNDDQSLEREADIMGAKALQLKSKGHESSCGCPSCTGATAGKATSIPIQAKAIVQRYCDLPGCTDPKCDDISNHGMSSFRQLRNVSIYEAERDKSDLGQGSGTSQGTRDYVQDSHSFYPEEVSLSYTSEDGTYSGYSSYEQPPRTPGLKPDAGHIFGNQYGGSGKDNANIFAQEPKHNRGNSHNGIRTFEKWRKTENEIRRGIQKGHKIRAMAKLHKKKRKKYHGLTISAQEYKDFLKRWRRRDDDHDKGGGGLTT